MVRTRSAGEGDEAPAQTKGTFDTFVNIAKVTEQIPEDYDTGKLKDVFKIWVKENSPRQFNFKELEAKVEIIMRLYRRKWKGRQYLSYVVKGQHEQVGMTTDIMYGKNGQGDTDTSIIIGRDRHPTLEWNEKLAREVLEQAKRYSDSVDMRFVFQNVTIVVTNEDNFFGDFDKLFAHATKKEII